VVPRSKYRFREAFLFVSGAWTGLWIAKMNDDGPILGVDEGAQRARLAGLKVEHQDLDAAVEALEAKPQPDQIQIARLKKKKLMLRDEIVRLEDQLTPDIIA
jgi:hypothetical protein